MVIIHKHGNGAWLYIGVNQLHVLLPMRFSFRQLLCITTYLLMTCGGICQNVIKYFTSTVDIQSVHYNNSIHLFIGLLGHLLLTGLVWSLSIYWSAYICVHTTQFTIFCMVHSLLISWVCAYDFFSSLLIFSLKSAVLLFVILVWSWQCQVEFLLYSTEFMYQIS